MMLSIGVNCDTDLFDLLPASEDKVTWLNNAINISLFTDARADDDDSIPDGTNDKRGYWGDIDLEDDQSLGSKLWLLKRSKLTHETLNLMNDYITEAVEWLVVDEHLLAITATVERDVSNKNQANFLLDCQLTSGDWVSIFRGHEVQPT
ncbi:phage GP46 family protein [Marinomonas sp. S3726]|uniref:phage GP46 family protein n=1 Tax=Marinomonas sp. S3726 TaxID=579484 RepID=UPI000696A206|nr:phage GP46 family protein [Marinomonas sp. S3726]